MSNNGILVFCVCKIVSENLGLFYFKGGVYIILVE